MELPVTPEEVIEMADYLGINIKTEYDLLWVARQVPMPLPALPSLARTARCIARFVRR